jgi:uncharacterized membrane protein
MQLGKLHLVLLHLPIALVVATAAADLLWAITRRKFFDNAGLYCLLGALVTAPLTVLTGSLLLDSKFEGHNPPLPEPLLAGQHETAGYIALCVIIAAAVIRVLWGLMNWKWLKPIYVLLILANLVTISIVGHLGGQLVFGENYLRGMFGGGIGN